MRVVTPELEAALDRLKAADDYFLEEKAIQEIRKLWPAKNMPQVVSDHRVPPDVIYLTQLECRIPFSIARLAGVAWMRRPIPAGGIPLDPADLTLADPEE